MSIVLRDSFIEMPARERARAILDEDGQGQALRAVVDGLIAAQLWEQAEQAAGERNKARGIEQIKPAARHREHRKSTDAARPMLIAVREEVLESQAEKKAQAEKQRDTGR